jgi:hypothetical protein
MDRPGGEPRGRRAVRHGESHFAEALAHAAIEKDLRVAWFTLETLTAAIGKAKADGSIARTVTRICRCNLIVVDDIGMLPAGQDAAEAFYRITDAAYERRSVAVTSNIHPRLDSTPSCPRPWPPPPWTAAAPRPPGPDQGRLAPARRSPRRQGGDPAGHLTAAPPGEQAATSLENWWPPARRKQDRPPRFPNGR